MTEAQIQQRRERRIIDPTKNVESLVKAQAKSQRDLRKADNRYYDVVMKNLRDESQAGRVHLADMATLRAEFWKDVRQSDLAVAAQTRLVDVNGQAASAASIATAVVTLQNASDRNNEAGRVAAANLASTLATQVTDSASGIQSQTQASNAAMEKRISDLEKVSNTGVGRQGVLDPQMSALIDKMDKLIPTVAAGGGLIQGKSEGISSVTAAILGMVAVFGLLLGAGTFIYEVTRPAPVAVAQQR